MSNKSAAKRIQIVSLKLVRESSILYNVRKISSPKEAAGLGQRFLEDIDREQVIVCCLDNKNAPISINVVSMGTLNASLIHPREIFKTAILSNSASIILFHNHPSGQTEASTEDINITKRIKEAGVLMGIELIDHIIIGSEGRFLSLKEEGLKFDAVLASDDSLAVGAVKYAHTAGISMPEELSIIGYNNSLLARCTDPEITSIDSKVEALCTTTVNTLMGVFSGANVPNRTTIASALIKRKTTNF